MSAAKLPRIKDIAVVAILKAMATALIYLLSPMSQTKTSYPQPKLQEEKKQYDEKHY